MQTRIALKHRNSIVAIPVEKSKSDPNPSAAALIGNMMTLGFIPSEDLLNHLNLLDSASLVGLAEDMIPELQKRKGADVVYNPMYPNFPEQVMEASCCELFFNAIMHYWSCGHWKPDYEKLPREFGFEDVKFKEIGVIDQQEFFNIFVNLLSSNESLSDGDKKIISWFIDESGIKFDIDVEIPFKENLCFVAARLLKKGGSLVPFIHTATDLLRVCTALSGGDISLAENTKFVSFPRGLRRHFVEVLNKVINEEDIERHRGRWIRLFHSLHTGEYTGKAAKIAHKIRSGGKIITFNGQVQEAINSGDYMAAVDLLKQRPGEFARRLDHMVRLAGIDYPIVANEFLSVMDKVPTRILLSILGNLKVRCRDRDKRIVFPKGALARATVVRKEIPALEKVIVDNLKAIIEGSLLTRFSKLDTLGKVWVDTELLGCPLPTGQRSASEGLIQVARGTRLSIGDDKNTLRFFVYWIGQDIDLSATLHGENLEYMDHISYSRLRDRRFESCHSGDIVQAPNGASEFIDITIDGALKMGARYVVMNVFVYNGPDFSEHEKVYAGWMTRTHPGSNEIYDPKTVENKIDLASAGRNSIPVVFDLKERMAIWADLTTKMRTHSWGNNVESNRASIGETLEAMVNVGQQIHPGRAVRSPCPRPRHSC